MTPKAASVSGELAHRQSQRYGGPFAIIGGNDFIRLTAEDASTASASLSGRAPHRRRDRAARLSDAMRRASSAPPGPTAPRPLLAGANVEGRFDLGLNTGSRWAGGQGRGALETPKPCTKARLVEFETLFLMLG